MNPLEEIKKEFQFETEEEFLKHAKSEAKKKGTTLKKMRAIPEEEFILLKTFQEVYKKDLTVEEVKKRQQEKTELELKGQEYKFLEKKYRVHSANGLEQLLNQKNETNKSLINDIQFFYQILYEEKIKNPKDIAIFISELKDKVNAYNNQEMKPTIITQNDPLVEENANQFLEVAAILGTENVIERIKELHELELTFELFSIEQIDFLLKCLNFIYRLYDYFQEEGYVYLQQVTEDYIEQANQLFINE